MRQNQITHDALVRKLRNLLNEKMFSDIRADLPAQTLLGEDPKPDLIFWDATKEGHIPDVTAYRNGAFHVFEVETEDTIDIQHTADQLTLFDAFAIQKNAVSFLVVPAYAELRAQSCVLRLGLKKTSVVGL